MPRWPIHLSVGLPCPAIVYAHYVVPTALVRALAEAKLIGQTRPSEVALAVTEVGTHGPDILKDTNSADNLRRQGRQRRVLQVRWPRQPGHWQIDTI